MSFAAINLIGDMFFNLFGNGMLIATILTLVIVFFLAVARVTNIAIYLVILVPMLLGWILNVATTNIIEIPPWIGYVVLLPMGIVLAMWLYNIKE